MRVTEALGLLGLKEDWGDERAMLRGTYAHKATALDDEGALNYPDLDDMLKPYVIGWRKFKTRMKPKILEIERHIEVPELGITGTLDRLLELDGWLYVVDIKTGGAAGWHKWQVALYSIIYNLSTGTASPRPACVYLDSKGEFKWQPYENPHRLKRRALALIEAAHVVAEVTKKAS